MASILKKGSSGSEVRRLQEALKNAGYNLGVDGIYGDETERTVRQYQQANNLSVDGIAGSQTWDKLTGSAGTGPAAAPSATTPLGTTYNPNETTGTLADLSALEGKAPAFQESQAYKDAMDALQQHQAARPGEYQSSFADRLNQLHSQIMDRGEYQSPYAGQIENIYNKIMERGDFSYDFNADPLYQQYKDQYIRGGQRAMQDTMANAAALTGGYGNSYAAAAGNQAYNEYLTGLNSIIPELHDRAYGRYRDEGDALLNQLQLVQGMDESAYGRYRDQGNDMMDRLNALMSMDQEAYNRHRDEAGDYYSRLEYLTGAAGDQYERDYAAHRDALDKYLADRDYYYGKSMDELAQKNYEAEKAAAQSRGSGGGSSSKSSGTKTQNQPAAEEDDSVRLTVAEAQNVLYQIAQSDGLTAASREMRQMIEDGIVDGEDVESKLKYALSMISRR